MHPPWQTNLGLAQAQLLARSLRHWTGRELIPGKLTVMQLAENIFHAPFAVLSHGTEADPILNYGNATALGLWEMSWAEFVTMPSRLTAEMPNREERAKQLAAVARLGFIDDYFGVRISRTGRRFEITGATVWNLVSPEGEPCGQAAMFAQWKFL